MIQATTLSPGIPTVLDERIKKTKEKNDPLQELQRASDRTLLKTKTVFPFTLFPDTIVVDYQKITIIKKKFFLSEIIDSINHADVLHVEVDTGPLFATLKITTKYFADKPMRIEYLSKKHALKARDIMHGLISARHADISIDDVDKSKLRQELERIGSVDEDIS